MIHFSFPFSSVRPTAIQWKHSLAKNRFHYSLSLFLIASAIQKIFLVSFRDCRTYPQDISCLIPGMSYISGKYFLSHPVIAILFPKIFSFSIKKVHFHRDIRNRNGLIKIEFFSLAASLSLFPQSICGNDCIIKLRFRYIPCQVMNGFSGNAGIFCNGM